MLTPASQPAPPQTSEHPLADAGLVVSSLGLAGWAVMLVLIAAAPPQKELTNHAAIDFFIGFDNLFRYLIQVLIGIVGLCINGTLSTIGTALGLSAVRHAATTKGKTALTLGLFGVSIGALLILWRMAAWGVFGG